ncbi:hypothetical protein XENORESO_008798 [Xenotaenia resolanae]|uniref:Uncharacterized protein n=1 Tax=Xenotaenia resolanae TaxID=208358 RepID=A0ABV0VPY3_9TELE
MVSRNDAVGETGRGGCRDSMLVHSSSLREEGEETAELQENRRGEEVRELTVGRKGRDEAHSQTMPDALSQKKRQDTTKDSQQQTKTNGTNKRHTKRKAKQKSGKF